MFFLAIAMLGNSVYSQSTQSITKQSIWTGAVNNEWNNPGNWNTGTVPDETTNTVIPNNTKTMPVVGGVFNFNSSTADINVQAGATLTIPQNHTLNVFGNIINTDESRYQILGRINFAGTNQLIPGFSYNSIAINGGGIKTVSGNAIVNGMFILVKGIVKTDEAHMLTLGAKAMITSGYSYAYIDGPLTRITNSTYNYTFPIGTNGVVRNITVVPNDPTTGAYTVAYYKTYTPNSAKFSCTNLIANKIDEYYDVKKAIGSANASVQLPYEASMDASVWSNKKNPEEGQNVAVVINADATWSYGADASKGLKNVESIPANVNGAIAGAVTKDDAHYGFGYGYSVIDSIEIIQFNALLNNDNGDIKYSVKQGNDLLATELEHSTDNSNFSTLDQAVTGNGEQNNYEHTGLSSGIHYYKLRLKDKAGNISYSKTIQLFVPDFKTIITGLKATMIRFDGYVNIQSANNQQFTFCIFDMSGRVVNKQSGSLMTGNNSIHFNSMMITPGIYNMYVQTADGVKATLRFMKE